MSEIIKTKKAKTQQHKTAPNRQIYALPDRRSQLEGREWLGEARSVADAYLYVILRWAGAFKMDLSAFPNVQAHFARIASGDFIVNS